jgi:hypothetical protein
MPLTQDAIEESDALIALLQERPSHRAVVCIERDDGGLEYDVFVAEFDNGDPASARCGRRIAIVNETGSARRLLDRAQDADTRGDTATWSDLPVRYGPYCSTWVLPEHPKAPSRPGEAPADADEV